MIIAGTGHRESKHQGGDLGVRSRVRNKLQDVYAKDKIEHVITGMAAGFDLWFADEAIELGIPVLAAVPWKGHAPRKADVDLYNKVKEAAFEVVYVDESENYPGPWVYQTRNIYMVDNATHVLIYLDPDCKEGGTWNCVQYINSLDDDVRPKKYNIWNDPPF